MTEDIQVKREITVEVDAEAVERMKEEEHARGFTIYCDEGERTGGDNSAPHSDRPPRHRRGARAGQLYQLANGSYFCFI